MVDIQKWIEGLKSGLGIWLERISNLPISNAIIVYCLLWVLFYLSVILGYGSTFFFLREPLIAIPLFLFSVAVFIASGLSIRVLSRHHKSEKVRKVDLIEIGLFAVVLLEFFTGNGRAAMLFLLGIMLYRVLHAMWEKYLGNMADSKMNNTLIGSGAMAFAIITYLVTIPFFTAAGTNICPEKPYELTEDANIFTVKINDLVLRHYGDRLGTVSVETKVYPETVIHSKCDGCRGIEYPKPDDFDDKNTRVHLQQVAFDFNVWVQSFKFSQQVSQRDHLVPFISSSRDGVRACECVVDKNNSKLDCRQPSPVNDFFLGTWFYRGSEPTGGKSDGP